MARRNTAGESYQIGELAARGGVTPDTLRYYERLGLLPEAPRTDGGFRLYSEAALDRLRFIKQAQTLGLTLHEVGDLVRYQDNGGVRRCRQVRDLLRAKLEDLQNKLTELEAFKQTLARFLDAGAVDELHLMVAPIVLGSGKTGLNLAPIETLDQAMRPLVRTMRFRDGDMLCMCDLGRQAAVTRPAEQPPV